MIVQTGYGYYTLTGHIVAKVQLPPGVHPDPSNGASYTEVADQAALDAVVIYVSPLTPAQAFNVTRFVEELMVAFSADANMLLYYAPIKDLASFQNFYGMNILVQGLLASTKITSQEVTTLNAVLANQNIVLSSFTTPS